MGRGDDGAGSFEEVVPAVFMLPSADSDNLAGRRHAVPVGGPVASHQHHETPTDFWPQTCAATIFDWQLSPKEHTISEVDSFPAGQEVSAAVLLSSPGSAR